MSALATVAVVWATALLWIGVIAARRGHPTVGGTIVVSGLIVLTVGAIALVVTS